MKATAHCFTGPFMGIEHSDDVTHCDLEIAGEDVQGDKVFLTDEQVRDVNALRRLEWADGRVETLGVYFVVDRQQVWGIWQGGFYA